MALAETEAYLISLRVFGRLPEYRYDEDDASWPLDLHDQWLYCGEVIYRKWGKPSPIAAHNDGNETYLLPDLAFNMADSNERYFCNSCFNTISFLGDDPRTVQFDGNLLNFHVAWCDLFITHYKFPVRFHDDMNTFEELLATTYKFKYKPPSYKTLVQYL